MNHSNNDYDASHLLYYPVLRNRQRQHDILDETSSDIHATSTKSISSSSNETPPRRTFSLRLRQRLSKLCVPISKANMKLSQQRQIRKEQRQQQQQQDCSPMKSMSSKKTSKSFLSKSIRSSDMSKLVVVKEDRPIDNDPTNFVVILLEDENYDNENEMGVVVLSKSSSASQLSTSRFKSGTTIALADELTVSSSSSGLSSHGHHVDIPTLHQDDSPNVLQASFTPTVAKSNEIGIMDSVENQINTIKSTENSSVPPEELGMIDTSNQNNVQPFSPSIQCNEEAIMTLKKLILTRSKPDFAMFMSCWLPSKAATTKTDIPKTAFHPCTKDCILHNILCPSEMMIPPAIMAAPKAHLVSETTTTAAECPSSISVPETESVNEKKVTLQPSKKGEEDQILPIFLARPFGDKDFTSLFSLPKAKPVTKTTTSIPRTIIWNHFKDMSHDEIDIMRQISSISGSSSEECSVVTNSENDLNHLHPIESHPLVSSGVIQKEEEEGNVFRQISEIYFEESSIIPNHHDDVDLSLAEAVAAVLSPLALEDQQTDVFNDPNAASIFHSEEYMISTAKDEDDAGFEISYSDFQNDRACQVTSVDNDRINCITLSMPFSDVDLSYIGTTIQGKHSNFRKLPCNKDLSNPPKRCSHNQFHHQLLKVLVRMRPACVKQQSVNQRQSETISKHLIDCSPDNIPHCSDISNVKIYNRQVRNENSIVDSHKEDDDNSNSMTCDTPVSEDHSTLASSIDNVGQEEFHPQSSLSETKLESLLEYSPEEMQMILDSLLCPLCDMPTTASLKANQNKEHQDSTPYHDGNHNHNDSSNIGYDNDSSTRQNKEEMEDGIPVEDIIQNIHRKRLRGIHKVISYMHHKENTNPVKNQSLDMNNTTDSSVRRWQMKYLLNDITKRMKKAPHVQPSTPDGSDVPDDSVQTPVPGVAVTPYLRVTKQSRQILQQTVEKKVSRKNEADMNLFASGKNSSALSHHQINGNVKEDHKTDGKEDDSSTNTPVPEHLRNLFLSHPIDSSKYRTNDNPWSTATEFVQPILKNLGLKCKEGGNYTSPGILSHTLLSEEDHHNEYIKKDIGVENAVDEVMASLILNASDMLSTTVDIDDMSSTNVMEQVSSSRNLKVDGWIEDVCDQMDELDRSVFSPQLWKKSTKSKPLLV